MDDVLASALAEAARTLGRTRTTGETLRTIVEVAQRSVPGFNHVGVSTLDRHGRAQTRAASSALVQELDDLQYGINEGPCVDSLRAPAPVSAPHIARDERWPRYVPEAVARGLRSQLAVRLYIDEQHTVGGLNLYSTLHDEIDPAAPPAADLFATQAVVVLGKIRELDHLHEALVSRETIGKAIGLMMAKYRMDSEAAFNYLARTSSHSNTKLRLVAERVIAVHQQEIERD